MNTEIYHSNKFHPNVNLTDNYENSDQNCFPSDNEINDFYEDDNHEAMVIDEGEEGYELNQNNNMNANVEDISQKSPDVNILINMDVANKSAVFIIEMPESWDTKVFNRFKTEETNTRIPGMKELQLTSGDSLDMYDSQNLKGKSERLNVEIEMSLCKENLTDSEICANLNMKPVNVKRLSKSDMSDVNHESDIDFHDPNLLQDPILEENIERQKFQFERNSFDESNTEKPKRFDFRYKLPKIPLLSFFDHNKSPDSELGQDNEPDNDFKSRLPKIEFPSFCGKGPQSNSDISIGIHGGSKLSHSDPNIHSHNNRFDFRYKLPKLRMPSICANDHESISDSDNEMTKRVKYSNSDPNIHSKNNRFDFRYQLPKLKLPSFSEKHKSENNSDSPVEENQPKRYYFRYQLPKLEFPSFNIQKKKNDDVDEEIADKPERLEFQYQSPAFSIPERRSSEEIEVEVQQKSSDYAVNDVNHPERFDFRYQLPKVELPKIPEFNLTLLGNKDKSGNVDHDIISDEDHFEKENHPDRFDFRYQLPKIELPEFNILRRSSTTRKDDLKQSEDESNIDRHPERFDFRYQLPKIEFPSLNILGRSPTVDVEDDVKIDSPEGDASIDRPPERFDFRYQLPKIELPEFSLLRRSSSARKEEDAILKSPEHEVNFDKPPERFDFRYQLPKIEFPDLNILRKASSVQLEDDVQVETTEDDGNIDKSPEKFDFRFSLPKIAFPDFFAHDKTPVIDSEFYYDINTDPYLCSMVDDFDVDVNDAAHNFPPPPPPLDIIITSENSVNLTKTPSINLSRKVSNPFAQVYMDNIDIKRTRSPDLSLSDSFSSLLDSRRRDWSKSSENIRPMNRYRLSSIDEQIQLNVSMPVCSNPGFKFGDEHSDIDIYPVPPRFVNLPNFSPLVSINTGSIPAKTSSDVGSIFSGQRKDARRVDDRFEPLSATMEAEIDFNNSQNTRPRLPDNGNNYDNDSDIQSRN